MEEELSLDNILGTEEIENLFTYDSEIQEPSQSDDGEKESPDNEDSKNKEEATEVPNVDNLFTDEPESVGSGKENTEEREDTTPKDGGSSPKNFYSSIAKALKEEGIFPDLDDEGLSKIKEPEDFRDLVEQQIRAGLDERQKRIDEALNVGVEPDEIKRYENTLQFLESINDDALKDESQKGEDLRKNLIF